MHPLSIVMPLKARNARRLVLAACAVCPALAAHAHALEGEAHAALPWSFEPWVLACLGLSAVWYAAGVVRLWRHAGRGRGIGVFPVVSFAAGWLALAAALVSPIDALGDDLFSAHMVQHEMLMIVAAPLLVVGRPLAAWAWGLPRGWRVAIGAFFHHPAWRRPWQVITAPVAAWALHAAALWGWHLPVLFDAALANEAVHALQHAAFLFTALLFWWSLVEADRRGRHGVALLSLFTTFAHTGVLGALLTLASVPFYAPYFGTTSVHGLTPLEDQQLGGLVMWIPSGLVYLVCGLVLAARAMASSARSTTPRLAGARAGRERSRGDDRTDEVVLSSGGQP